MSDAAIQDAEVILPEGTLIRVTMEVRLPHAADEKHVSDWLEHNIAHCGGIDVDNPLYSDEPEAWGSRGLQWEDTGLQGRREEFGHEDLGNGRTRYSVRYHRDRRV